MELFTKLLAIPIVLIGIRFGIVPMLIGINVVSIISYLMSAVYIKKLYHNNFKNQFSHVYKGLFLYLTSLLLCLSIESLDTTNLYLKLFLKLILISIIFLIGIPTLFPELITELKKLKKIL
jgi:hypothetical protein